MSFFVKLQWEVQDRKIFRAIRLCTGEWSTTHQAVMNLRDRLLELQNSRCVYCQSIIEVNENGYRELEHVLPKKESKGCTIAKGTSNDFKKRRSTLGYPEFTYEPRNLAISCKQCNTKKGTYDPLRDRSAKRPLVKYPGVKEIEWFHPHYQKYSEHILLDENFLFAEVTPEGGRVIEVCGLADPKVLEKKFLYRARARTKQMRSLTDAVEYLMLSVRALTFSSTHAIQAISDHFKIDFADAQVIFQLFQNAQTAADREKAMNACLVIERRLSRAKTSVVAVASSLRKI